MARCSTPLPSESSLDSQKIEKTLSSFLALSQYLLQMPSLPYGATFHCKQAPWFFPFQRHPIPSVPTYPRVVGDGTDTGLSRTGTGPIFRRNAPKRGSLTEVSDTINRCISVMKHYSSTLCPASAITVEWDNSATLDGDHAKESISRRLRADKVEERDP